ncbi:MAG TPA: hypothetical protein VLL72_08145 [Kiloniellales bacterium]|nr:hypothetical protein [Kiloniellales bacterium]
MAERDQAERPDSARVQAAYEKAVRTYGRRPNVTGVDVGYKYDGGRRSDVIAVRIHVEEKIPVSALEAAEVLPSEIDGVPVDVIQGHYSPNDGTAEAALGLDERRQRRDPIQPGISISHPLVSAGTLGAIVYDRRDGRACLLSNWHVLAGSLFARAGDPILQPGRFDGGRRERDVIATLRRMHLGPRGDAAIAALNDARGVETAQGHSGVRVVAARRATLGDVVTKSGRTTGMTSGVVDGVGRYRVAYSVGPQTIEGFIIRVREADNPANREISAGGDSGSLWYDPFTEEGLGLHFAGETDPAPAAEYALACHLEAVLDELGVSLRPVEPATDAPVSDQPAEDDGVPGSAPTLADLLARAGVGEEMLRELVPPGVDLGRPIATPGVNLTGGGAAPLTIEIGPPASAARIRISVEPPAADA